MKAFVYRRPGLKAIEDRPKPEIQAPGDAIVKMIKTTICGTDLEGRCGDLRAGPYPRSRGCRRHR